MVQSHRQHSIFIWDIEQPYILVCIMSFSHFIIHIPCMWYQHHLSVHHVQVKLQDLLSSRADQQKNKMSYNIKCLYLCLSVLIKITCVVQEWNAAITLHPSILGIK